MMSQIYETKNFIVEAYEKPFVSREEGGHIRIKIKDEEVKDRTKLSPSQAIEFIRLSMVVGEAFETAMKKRGVPIIKINYQDMGNWAYKTGTKNYFHMHILGRVLGAKNQPFPESVYLPDRSTGFYDDFKPLNEEDAEVIKVEIERIIKEEKYQDKNWYN